MQDFIEHKSVPALDGGVFKSDTAISIFDKTRFLSAASRLETSKCKFPNISNGIVNTVDPFLYPFAFAKTRTLRNGTVALHNCVARSGEGEAVKMPREDECAQRDNAKYPNDMAWSRRFQWLPFDVTFERQGSEAPRQVMSLVSPLCD